MRVGRDGAHFFDPFPELLLLVALQFGRETAIKLLTSQNVSNRLQSLELIKLKLLSVSGGKKFQYQMSDQMSLQKLFAS